MSDEEIHARLAPFAGVPRDEMDRFNRWQDGLYAARAKRRGGTQAGAPGAGEEGDRQ
jgi:hypothetical protein